MASENKLRKLGAKTAPYEKLKKIERNARSMTSSQLAFCKDQGSSTLK